MSTWTDWDRCPPGDALREADPEIARADRARRSTRQNDGLELIASENFVSPAVLEAMGSPLTNKYAEGLPGKRYYGGCEVVDKVEQLAIDRAKQLFGAEHANVQPHSGAQANAAVYLAFLKPGDTFLGMDLSQGGHLTHGSPVNFSGHAVQGDVTTASNDDGLHRLRRHAQQGARAQAEDDHRRLQRVLARHRLRARSPRSRRRSARCSWSTWRTSPGSSRPACYPSPVPHADVVTTHDAQDAARPARRADPLQGRAREGGRQGDVPRHAGRSARARDRRQGGGVQGGAATRRSRSIRRQVVANAQALADGARRRAASRSSPAAPTTT